MMSSHPDDLTVSDYADGTLAAPLWRDVDAHVASCDQCRSVIDGLRRVRAAVHQLPSVPAPLDGWSRLEHALRSATGAPRRTQWQWLAVAAALVVAVLGGVKLGELRRTTSAPNAVIAAEEDATSESVQAELQQAEQHYQNAIAGLERIAESGKSSLDPQLATTIENNLAVVDQAMSESQAVLKGQPRSEPAQASLLESFKAKIALLEDTIALINEMRRGPSVTPDTSHVLRGLTQKVD